MQFGMPALIELKTPEACAALCFELGLAFVELNMNLPEYQTIDIERLRGIAGRYGIYYTIHLDENMNPCDFNPKVAAAYTETMLQAIETAKRLPAPVLNIHMSTGIYFTLPGRKVFLYDEYEPGYLQKLMAFRDQCTAAVGEDAIRICVENCGSYDGAPFMQKGLDLLLESPVFALTFDVGHSAAAGFTDEPAIMRRAERLCHFHIHDAKGKDNHLTLGTGELDIGDYLDLAKTHDCRAVLEVKTVEGLRQSVDWLKENGAVNRCR